MITFFNSMYMHTMLAPLWGLMVPTLPSPLCSRASKARIPPALFPLSLNFLKLKRALRCRVFPGSMRHMAALCWDWSITGGVMGAVAYGTRSINVKNYQFEMKSLYYSTMSPSDSSCKMFSMGPRPAKYAACWMHTYFDNVDGCLDGILSNHRWYIFRLIDVEKDL